MISKFPKAISLLSGGLDSTLATIIVQRLGVEVIAVSFITPFGCDATDNSSCSRNALPAAQQFGFPLKLNNLGQSFLEIVKNPKHGHGKNMNPCIDCRILMLKEARILMDMIGADFLVTGEVVGQRPMSQRKDTLRMIEKRAGVKGLVLRPLSAKNLPATIAEENGLIKRDDFYAFTGRTRKPQIELARRLGLTDYPAPAGGCLLTEPVYSKKLRHLLSKRTEVEFDDIELLRSGRQFWTEDGCWIVVGRNEADNQKLKVLKRSEDELLYVTGVGSPTVLVRYFDSGSKDDLIFAGAICARYTRKRSDKAVSVLTSEGKSLIVKPMTDSEIQRFRV